MSNTHVAPPTHEELAVFRDLSLSFGEERVAPATRAARVRTTFDAVAAGYDRANDLMSGGLHRSWKRRLVELVDQRGPVLDLAGGTGDVAAALRRRGGLVVNGDASPAMLAVDHRRHGAAPRVVLAAEALPFPDRSLGAVTLAFGFRNFTSPTVVLGEIARVLQPGGRLYLLEFSKARAWLHPLYAAASRALLPRIGGFVTGKPEAYRYLAASIARFPSVDQVSAGLKAAGFAVERVERPTFGICAIHVARRLEVGAWTA